jgi:hypothetical protein
MEPVLCVHCDKLIVHALQVGCESTSYKMAEYCTDHMQGIHVKCVFGHLNRNKKFREDVIAYLL